MIRMVCSDMDGTFLHSSGQILEENMRMLEVLAERGIEFVPASGRPGFGIPQPIAAAKATHYIISSNGARLTRVEQGREVEVLVSNRMKKEVVVQLYDEVGDLDITFDVLVDGKTYTERRRYEQMERFIPNPHVRTVSRSLRTPIDGTIPELLRDVSELEKVTILANSQSNKHAVLAAVDAKPELCWTSSMQNIIEISDVRASKGAALSTLADYLGIPLEATVAFGDNLNDVSMLKVAGTGIAMANATKEAQEAADLIGASCDEAGVAKYLATIL